MQIRKLVPYFVVVSNFLGFNDHICLLVDARFKLLAPKMRHFILDGTKAGGCFSCRNAVEVVTYGAASLGAPLRCTPDSANWARP